MCVCVYIYIPAVIRWLTIASDGVGAALSRTLRLPKAPPIFQILLMVLLRGPKLGCERDLRHGRFAVPAGVGNDPLGDRLLLLVVVEDGAPVLGSAVIALRKKGEWREITRQGDEGREESATIIVIIMVIAIIIATITTTTIVIVIVITECCLSPFLLPVYSAEWGRGAS